ncbi:Gfo/Idh/MocA family oxidoreductase [Aquabacterium sp. A7-Y]|uniref:Gfo/Idh/MocA family protein n=1 Tax=Aquabacterium sp. A7-Y TaxID=1349605 RepID=UPI00223DD8B6|nr:Gfo/Idh/MocA family oxidoreductase [Aquabacterium sp. A7-Y]MCW7538975.1 Gfo/Idh/MocA family oxidoreductase [Aquabacterium sp. A7-Y]
MSVARIPIVVVGLGWVGLNRHVAALRRSKEFELIGVVDHHDGRAAHWANKLSLKNWAQSYSLNDVPWLRQAHAVAIATPPQTHFGLVKQALDQGLHVLTEKPFAMSVDEGRRMVEQAERVSRILAVVHNFQFATSALALRRDIDSGALGTIHRVHAMQLSNPGRRLPSWYEDLPFGLFYDESPHLLYLLRAFSPAEIRLKNAIVVHDSPRRTPAMVQGFFECHAGGREIPVTIDMQFLAPLSEWHLAVVGDKRMGVVDIFRDIYLSLPNDGMHTTGTVLKTSLAASLQHWGQHFTSGVRHLRGTLDYGNNELYGRFARALRTGVPPAGMDAKAALDVLSMQHDLMQRAE